MLLNYLRGTTTSTGLTVRATLLEGVYAKGQKISDTEMEHLNIEPGSGRCSVERHAAPSCC